MLVFCFGTGSVVPVPHPQADLGGVEKPEMGRVVEQKKLMNGLNLHTSEPSSGNLSSLISTTTKPCKRALTR
jgi:hypothetical protein